jgi:hypothetical protein
MLSLGTHTTRGTLFLGQACKEYVTLLLDKRKDSSPQLKGPTADKYHTHSKYLAQPRPTSQGRLEVFLANISPARVHRKTSYHSNLIVKCRVAS